MSTAANIEAPRRRRSGRFALPGFGLSMGITLLYLSLIVLIPLSTIAVKASGLGLGGFWRVVTAPRALDAIQVTLMTSFAAALVNVVFGVLVAWVLVRYQFPGRTILDGLIDLPFALPTAVSGIALAQIFDKNGWLGRIGFQLTYTRWGIILALTFIGLPFVVRTVQPVLEELDASMEEAAATLGASRWQTFKAVIFPNLVPPVLTGFALAFARGIGEYGSVIFISGNRKDTTIAPVIIMRKLERFDYAGATAIALVMLVISFGLLLIINRLQAWSRARITRG